MKKIIILCALTLVVNLGFAQTKAEKTQLKEEKTKVEYDEIKSLIDSGIFAFEADWAQPLAGQRINLIGNHNYLKMENGKVDAYLPYFGVVHSGGGYSGTGGIVFKGEVSDYKVSFNDKKRKIVIKFYAKNKSERYDVILTVHKSGNASIIATSSSRSTINYDGKVRELEKVKNK